MEKDEMKVEKVDFRDAKETAKTVVREISNNDPNWNWKVDVLKNEIRVWWEYLQYCDTKNSHFTIKMEGNEDKDKDVTNFMIARGPYGDFMSGRFIGESRWEDGDLNTCVAGLLKETAEIAHRYY